MQGFDLSEYGDQTVVVVIPARNEAQTIARLVSESAKYAHRVLVMDGHSTDETAALATEAGATVHLDPGRGKGSALRQSLEIADADVVVFMDADGSHDPADIPRLAKPVLRREAALCVGSRFSGGSDELSVDFGQLIRTIGNISMNIAINVRWGTRLSDTLNGFRAVRRTTAQDVGLREDRHTIEQEMVMKVLRYGHTVVNVPAHEYEREYGDSHINIWKEWPKFVWCVFVNIARRDVPLEVSVREPEAAVVPELEAPKR